MTANKMTPKIRRDEEALDQADFVGGGTDQQGDDADEHGQQDHPYQESIDEAEGTCEPARSPRIK